MPVPIMMCISVS